MTIDEMSAKKKEYGYSYEYIAEKSGVPLSTVQKIFGGTTTAPRKNTLDALRKVFEKVRYADDDYEISIAEEGGVNYVSNGTGALAPKDAFNKTIKDYLALPEGARVELIDGTFYDMAAPSPVHQIMISSISTVLGNHIDINGGKCLTFIAPTDVQLDSNDKTMVQPDIFVVCDRKKVTKDRIKGAPDLIIEVLSPSNWYNDTTRKLIKYKNAGVHEYWIVMPENRKVLVYNFDVSDIPTEYTFNDNIAVNIWNGECSVDFRKISDKINFLL